MIDLKKALPDTVTVDGRVYAIKTDFRVWLEFGELIEDENTTISDISFVFKDDIPPYTKECLNALINFYANQNKIPNYSGGGNERVLDFNIDSEYIYASYWAEYNIDLFEVDLHWHKFKALFLGLSEESAIKQIIIKRVYTKSNKDPDKIARENKKAWALPRVDDIDEEETERELEKLFYNC